MVSLLSKLSDLSSIFLGCLSTDKKAEEAKEEEENKPKLLAEKIDKTQKAVNEKLSL